ncbi:hypothetical protein [Parerythrobacter aestuarii]|uniref:hypothetical protein n=1 Tax=Parerythrobacter aestuarii TaxID=3020909 RepID=UPI0024DEF6FF|nr:hypothetical protein [Parerythrobacter aestuarii]
MRKILLSLAVLAAPTVPASAEDTPKWIESPVIFMPADVEAGERLVTEGEIIVDVPLRWAFAGKLEQDVTVIAAGEEVVLKAGEVLPQVMVPVPGSGAAGRILLCTRSKVVFKREGIGFIAKLVDDLRDSLSDAQRCVEDTDNDGKVDRALVLGEGKEEIPAEPIEPVGFKLTTAEVIPGDEDKVTLTLVSVGNKRSSLALNIIQLGAARQFDTMVSGRFYTRQMPTFQHKDGLPATLNAFGIGVRLLEADKKGNNAKLSWSGQAREGEYAVIPRTTKVSFGY